MGTCAHALHALSRICPDENVGKQPDLSTSVSILSFSTGKRSAWRLVASQPMSDDYFHYINGHTLEVDSGAKQGVHLHVPYLCRQHHTPRNGVAQGQQGYSHRYPRLFMSEPTRVGAEDRRFHGQLMHVRECLEQATLRTIYGTPYDGEVTVGLIPVRSPRGRPSLDRQC